MNVTRDVVMDLLAVVESGEASADSKVLVEEFLAGDPEFKALVAKGEGVERALGERPVVALGSEVTALNSIVRTVRRRTTFLSFAILFTLWPFAFTFDAAGVYFLFHGRWREALVVWLVALGLWANFFHQRKKAKALGV